jgi:hypothetical protein
LVLGREARSLSFGCAEFWKETRAFFLDPNEKFLDGL